MAKEQAVYFLSENSIEDLESSVGAVTLIQIPKDIEELNGLIKDLKRKRKADASELEGLKKGYEDLFKLTFIQKIFKGKKIQQEKKEYIEKIGKLAKEIASYDSKIGSYSEQILVLKANFDNFVAMLLRLKIEPQDVIDEYNRLKDIFERKARGEYVEEVAAVVEESAKTEQVKVSTKTTTPAQNSKKNPRLSQREKFERRLAATAELSKGSKQKQPGEE